MGFQQQKAIVTVSMKSADGLSWSGLQAFAVYVHRMACIWFILSTFLFIIDRALNAETGF